MKKNQKNRVATLGFLISMEKKDMSVNTAENKETDWKYHFHRKIIYEHFRKFNPESVLEAGCDKGGNLEWLIEYFPKIKKYGCDISDEDVAYGQKHFPEFEITKGDVRNLPYSDKSIDVAIMDMVFYQTEYNPKAIEELKRVAKKGVIISDRNFGEIQNLLPSKYNLVIHNWDNEVGEFNDYYIVSFKV